MFYLMNFSVFCNKYMLIPNLSAASSKKVETGVCLQLCYITFPLTTLNNPLEIEDTN